LFYWKDKHEVDFVLDFSGKIVAIKVKYKKELEDNDLEGILEFMEIFKLRKGIVVTKNAMEINDKELYPCVIG